jgi:hypothetical protein
MIITEYPGNIHKLKTAGANEFCGDEGEKRTRNTRKILKFSRVSLISRVSRSLLDIGPNHNHKNR